MLVRNNTALSDGGGGIFNGQRGRMWLESGTVVRDNYAGPDQVNWYRGAGGGVTNSHQMVLRAATVAYNWCEGAGGGGGISNGIDSDLWLFDSEIAHNVVRGGRYWLWQFDNNHSYGWEDPVGPAKSGGGGGLGNAGCVHAMDGCDLHDNAVQGDRNTNLQNWSTWWLDHGDPSGGGVGNAGNMSMTNSRVRRNYAFENAGGIAHSPKPEPGWEGTLNIMNSSVSDNIADGVGHDGYFYFLEGIGGGVAVIVAYISRLHNTSTPVRTLFNLIDSEVYNNSAIFGAGLWLGFGNGTWDIYDKDLDPENPNYPCAASVERSRIYNNSGRGKPLYEYGYDENWYWFGSKGGGLSVDCKLNLADTLVANNTANKGAGLSNRPTSSSFDDDGPRAPPIIVNRSSFVGNRNQPVPIKAPPVAHQAPRKFTNAGELDSSHTFDNNGDILFLLPLERGHYMENTFLCSQQMCPNGTTPNNPCRAAQQTCPEWLWPLEAYVHSVPKGPVSANKLPDVCFPGYRGDRELPQFQRDNTCGGPCPVGFECRDGEIEPCPKGKYAAIRGVKACADCPVGYFCTTTNSTPVPCPSGHYGKEVGLTNELCSGLCPQGYYCPPRSIDPKPCLQGMSTLAAGAEAAGDCLCAQATGSSRGFFIDLTVSPTACSECTLGFDCSGATSSANTTTVAVAQGYWRPSASATEAHLCPIASACVGGPSAATFDVSRDDTTGCTEGLAGPYCTGCAEADHYLDTARVTCRPCSTASQIVGGVLGGAALLAVLLFLVCLVRGRRRKRGAQRKPRLADLDEAAVAAPEEAAPPEEPPVPVNAPAVEDELTPASPPRKLVRAVSTATSDGFAELSITASALAETRVVRTLRHAKTSTDVFVKLKLCYAVALIVAQMSDVYVIRYPPNYRSVSEAVFAPFRGQLFAWIPSLDWECFGIRGLFSQLVLYTLFPLGLCLLRLLAAWCTHRSLVPALPFVLRFIFLVATMVSSKGFQALAPCDCFPSLDGAEVCLKSSDYNVLCPIKPGLGLFAWLAVLLYGVSVPLAYAALLFRCRDAIRSGASTRLSRALSFLTDQLQKEALWWPLFEAMRALLLTGFLALVSPGSITQLLFGLLVAIAFLVLETWCAPYQNPGNNYVALIASTSLVLNFISSLGVQFNSVSGNGLVNASLLSAGLFIAAFAVFVVTTFTFISALRKK